MRLLLICLFLLDIVTPCKAQYNSLLNKSYAARRAELRTFYTDEIIASTKNLQVSQKKVDAIQSLALEHKDRDLALEACLMQLHIYEAFKLKSRKENLASVDSLFTIAENEKVHWLKCRTQSFAAILCYADGENYEQAFNYAEQLSLSLQTVTKEDLPEKQICYYQIGYYYYQFHDWDNAFRYFQLGLKETPSVEKDQFQMLCCNTMGLIYEKRQQYDSAISYYNKALASIVKKDATQNVWKGILKGNIGNCLCYKKLFAEAKPYLQTCIDSSLFYHEKGIVSDAYLTLGMIALDENKLEEASNYLQQSRYYCQDPWDYSRFEKLYPALAKLEQKQGHAELTSRYLDSALVVKDSMARKLNALYILRGNQKAIGLKQRKLEEDKRLKTTQRNFLIVIVILLMLVGLYIIYAQRKRYEQKRLIHELQLEQQKQELSMATEQLNEFAKTISEKNRLLEELEKKLGNSPDIALLTELRESTILTDAEWERFRKLFEQVHKGFTLRLKEKLPDLTQAETRLMVLAKLKFSNREMANALNISTQAIRTTWYRLRKKLNLPEEGSLEELVETI